MAAPKGTVRRAIVSDGDAAKSVVAAVKLATRALDGRGLSDQELDDLCDAVLSQKVALSQSKKLDEPKP